GKSRLYIGDQFGRLRPIADIESRYIVAMAGWRGNDKVWAIVVPLLGEEPTLTRSVVTVDITTGAVERRSLDPDVPIGRTTDDGRWIPLPLVGLSPSTLASCGLIGALYDVAGKRTVDIVDSSGR